MSEGDQARADAQASLWGLAGDVMMLVVMASPISGLLPLGRGSSWPWIVAGLAGIGFGITRVIEVQRRPAVSKVAARWFAAGYVAMSAVVVAFTAYMYFFQVR